MLSLEVFSKRHIPSVISATQKVFFLNDAGSRIFDYEYPKNAQMKVEFLKISANIVTTIKSLTSRSCDCVLKSKPFYANQ